MNYWLFMYIHVYIYSLYMLMSFSIIHFSSKQSQNARTLAWECLHELELKGMCLRHSMDSELRLSVAGRHPRLWRQNDMSVKNHENNGSHWKEEEKKQKTASSTVKGCTEQNKMPGMKSYGWETMELVVYIRLMVRRVPDVPCQSFSCSFWATIARVSRHLHLRSMSISNQSRLILAVCKSWL